MRRGAPMLDGYCWFERDWRQERADQERLAAACRRLFAHLFPGEDPNEPDDSIIDNVRSIVRG